MALDNKLRGIIVPLVLPFKDLDSENRVDEESLANLVGHVIDSGVHGVFINGNAGEFLYTTPEEKLTAARIVSENARQRNRDVAVCVGATGKTEGETRDLIEKNSALTREGYEIDALVLAPLVYLIGGDLVLHLKDISVLTEIPIILYTNPGIANQNNLIQNIKPLDYWRLLEDEKTRGKIAGLKDSSADKALHKKYIAATNKHPSRILMGDERLALYGLEQGSSGLVPTLANIFPEFLVQFYDSYREDGEKMQEELIELGNKFYLGFANVIGGLKTTLKLRGIIENNLSIAAPQVSLAYEEELRRHLSAYLL